MSRILTAEEQAEMAADYIEGWTTAELADWWGVSAKYVADRLRKMGVELRPPGSRPGSRVRHVDPLAYEGQWVRDGLVMRPTLGRAS